MRSSPGPGSLQLGASAAKSPVPRLALLALLTKGLTLAAAPPLPNRWGAEGGGMLLWRCARKKKPLRAVARPKVCDTQLSCWGWEKMAAAQPNVLLICF